MQKREPEEAKFTKSQADYKMHHASTMPIKTCIFLKSKQIQDV